jgi:hypothetical protein
VARCITSDGGTERDSISSYPKDLNALRSQHFYINSGKNQTSFHAKAACIAICRGFIENKSCKVKCRRSKEAPGQSRESHEKSIFFHNNTYSKEFEIKYRTENPRAKKKGFVFWRLLITKETESWMTIENH